MFVFVFVLFAVVTPEVGAALGAAGAEATPVFPLPLPTPLNAGAAGENACPNDALPIAEKVPSGLTTPITFPAGSVTVESPMLSGTPCTEPSGPCVATLCAVVKPGAIGFEKFVVAVGLVTVDINPAILLTPAASALTVMLTGSPRTPAGATTPLNLPAFCAASAASAALPPPGVPEEPLFALAPASGDPSTPVPPRDAGCPPSGEVTPPLPGLVGPADTPGSCPAAACAPPAGDVGDGP